MNVQDEWWRNPDTKIKDIIDHPNGITSLHAKNVNGIYHYALVWWFYGSPTLHLLFAD